MKKKRKVFNYNSITKLLLLVKKGKIPYDVESRQGFPPIVFVNETQKNIAKVSIERKFVHGLGITYESGGFMPGLIVDDPVLTPEGERYLREQSLLQKYPIIEKIFTIILTGVVSAITTLLINYFVNQ